MVTRWLYGCYLTVIRVSDSQILANLRSPLSADFLKPIEGSKCLGGGANRESCQVTVIFTQKIYPVINPTENSLTENHFPRDS